MNKTQRRKAHLIIHSASTAAAGVGAGMAQLPFPDATVLLPIQTAMVIVRKSVPRQAGARRSKGAGDTVFSAKGWADDGSLLSRQASPCR